MPAKKNTGMAFIQIPSVFRFYPDCLLSYDIYYLVYNVVKINSIDYLFLVMKIMLNFEIHSNLLN